MARNDADHKRVATRVEILPTVIYVGYADYVANVSPATSSPSWTIKKVTLTAGSPTQIAWTTQGSGVWDSRSTEAYA